MRFRECMSKNAGVAGYVKAFWHVLSESQTGQCINYLLFAVLGSFAIRPPEPVCACRPGSSRCGSIYLLVALPTAIAVGSLWACLLLFYAFSSAVAVGSLWACLLFFYAFSSAVAVGSLWACLLFVYALPGLRRARSGRVCYSFTLSPRLLPWARSGLAQHHIECHHEAEAHHKCYGGAV